MNGVLEFYDTSDVVCMNQAEHFMATDVEWDPTGRFVATSVSWWAHKVSYSLQCLLKYSSTSNNSHPSAACTHPYRTRFQSTLQWLLNSRPFVLSQNRHCFESFTASSTLQKTEGQLQVYVKYCLLMIPLVLESCIRSIYVAKEE